MILDTVLAILQIVSVTMTATLAVIVAEMLATYALSVSLPNHPLVPQQVELVSTVMYNQAYTV